MNKLDIALDEDKLEQVSGVLNIVLADEYLLYTKTFNYHWNVSGKYFYSLHELFEEQYKKLQQVADEVAERIRQRGGVAQGSMNAFLKNARLKEQESSPGDSDTMVANLLSDHEELIRYIREDIEKLDELDDVGSEDLLIKTIQVHEKMAWMLRSLTQ